MSAASKHPVTARTKARRRAVEILFEADQRHLLGYNPENPESLQRRVERLTAFGDERAQHSANQTEAPAYTYDIIRGVAEHLDHIDEVITTYSQGWTLERMPAVDRAICRIAVWEMLYNEEVDAPVALDEAMTLGRMLSTDESPRFLNGLLGRVGDLADTLI